MNLKECLYFAYEREEKNKTKEEEGVGERLHPICCQSSGKSLSNGEKNCISTLEPISYSLSLDPFFSIYGFSVVL